MLSAYFVWNKSCDWLIESYQVPSGFVLFDVNYIAINITYATKQQQNRTPVSKNCKSCFSAPFSDEVWTVTTTAESGYWQIGWWVCQPSDSWVTQTAILQCRLVYTGARWHVVQVRDLQYHSCAPLTDLNLAAKRAVCEVTLPCSHHCQYPSQA